MSSLRTEDLPAAQTGRPSAHLYPVTFCSWINRTGQLLCPLMIHHEGWRLTAHPSTNNCLGQCDRPPQGSPGSLCSTPNHGPCLTGRRDTRSSSSPQGGFAQRHREAPTELPWGQLRMEFRDPFAWLPAGRFIPFLLPIPVSPEKTRNLNLPVENPT